MPVILPSSNMRLKNEYHVIVYQRNESEFI
jgi:hypothetical protein